MTLIDIVIIAIIAISILIGLFRGFINEIFSLFSWIGALYIAYVFCVRTAIYLEPYLDQPPLRVVIAFAGLFVVSLITFSIVSHVIYRELSMVGISGVDRSLGTLFGLVRGIIIVAALILGFTFMDFTTQPWWTESSLVAYFTPVTEFIRSLLPADLAKFIAPTIIPT